MKRFNLVNNKKVKSRFTGYVIMFYLGFLIAFLMIGSFNTNLFQSINSFLVKPTYKINEINYYNDSVVTEIVDICSLLNDEKQVECVVNLVGNNYNYKLREEENKSNNILIKTPSKFFEEGGLCRDIAITYSSVFRNLGWFTNYEFSKNHIYNKISNSNYICYIDGSIYDCLYRGV